MEWTNTSIIRGDVASALARLKEQPGRDFVQYGLRQVSITLLEHGLLDELRLWIHPVILGLQGPSTPHFRDSPLARLRLLESTILPNGIAVLRNDARGANDG